MRTFMPKITALIHASATDARRLGRLLETLRPCDEVLIVNIDSAEDVTRIAREYGASIKNGVPGVSPGTYLMDARNDWILSLLPSESLTEGLEASLFEWKAQDHDISESFSVRLREETANGWTKHPAVTRLVNREAVNWISNLPKNDPRSQLLAGDLLRFANP
jgi:hypothetical protein